MSVVDDLGDEVWIIATDMLGDLVSQFEAEVGRRPSIGELCEILTAAAWESSGDLVGDGSNLAIRINGALKKLRQPDPKSGDLLAVPVDHRYACLLCLGQFGTFGTAFGVFSGRHSLRHLQNSNWEAEVRPYPIFADRMPVVHGRWRIVGKRPDLVSKFRKPRQFYHPGGPHYDATEYGRFGIAEDDRGTLKKISRAEALKIFGAKNEWTQEFFTQDALEARLEAFTRE